MDVKNAFRRGDLREFVYTSPPPAISACRVMEYRRLKEPWAHMMDPAIQPSPLGSAPMANRLRSYCGCYFYLKFI